MKVNKNSSAYIIIYATVMVVIVATVLALASMGLAPTQKANLDAEKKGAILASAGVATTAKTVEAEYAKYITEVKVSASDGRILPLYKSTAGGQTLYIVPVAGKGLWGPLWGYLAVEGDWNTVSGVVFDHKGETPGLGAEITKPIFTNQFVGKHLFEGTQLVGIAVLKGAGASKGNDHAVDAISGGTLTSRGVEKMILATLQEYLPYIEAQKSAPAGTAGADDSGDNNENTLEEDEK